MIKDFSIIPFVGQMLDYYPDNSSRVPALCIQVHPSDLIDRPNIDIQVFWPNGEISHKENIEPAQLPEVENAELENKWAFSHEFAIQQDATLLPEEEKGTETNRHVGSFQSY